MFQNQALYHIITPIILALLVNGIIFTFKFNDTKPRKYLPPGYIIGTIWMIIFGLLGYVHYLIYKENNNKITFTSLYIIFIIIYCLAYPFITGLKFKTGLLLNLFALILSFILGIVIIMQSKYIFIFVLPLILWASYVNIIDVIECSNVI